MGLSVFIAAMRFEWRLSWRDRAVWASCIALLFSVGFALHNGAARVATQESAIEAARADETRRLTSLRKTLKDIDAGRIEDELPPFRDPRNAIFVGGGSGAAVAVLPPAPLAIVAIGQSDLYPAAIKVTSGGKDSFLFSDEIENPAHLASGSIDLAFVLVFLFPLAILALCYDLISSEREKGTLSLTLASARDPRLVLSGKLAVRAGIPLAATLIAIVAGVAFYSGAAAVVSADFSILSAAVVGFGVFWALLAAAVNGRDTDSAHNALALMTAWVVVTLIIPSAINAVSNLAYPPPSRVEMVLAARAASIDADKQRDATLARYADEHKDATAPDMKRGSDRERSLRRLAVQEAARARVDSVVAASDAQLQRQHDLANRLSFASPALLMYRAVVDLAGAGEARYAAFLSRIDDFHDIWRGFFLDRARAGQPLAAEDYDKFPRFEQTRAPNASASGSLGAFGFGVAPLALLFAYYSWCGFRQRKAV
jgi:ABC-2 type transport system permease protein